MPILDAPKPRTPSLKLGELGNSAVFALVDIDTVPLTIYGTRDVEIGQDGRPRTQDVLYGIIQSADGATITDDGEERAPEPGELVAVWCAKGTRGLWVDAKMKYGAAINTGDLVRWVYERTEKATKAGHNDRIIRSFSIKAPTPAQADVVAACEAAYAARQQHTQLSEPAAAPPYVGAGAPADEEQW